MFQKNIALLLLSTALLSVNIQAALDRPRYNGDIYIIKDADLNVSAEDDIETTTMAPRNKNDIDFDAIVHRCNSSFITPESYVIQFNNTGSMPDEQDKTGQCYFHCFFEKAGLLKDWKFNAELMRKYIWPATGDSLEVCENEGKDENNACVRGYAIIKCFWLRVLTDARNDPVV